MRVGIDASNLRAGGALTHLVELLRGARPAESGFDEVIVWGGSSVLSQLEDRSWLRKVPQPLLEQAANPFRDRRHLHRAFWQRFRLRKLAKSAACDVLFVPGGLDSSGFSPMVTMSQNMMPFEPGEAERYGMGFERARLFLLKRLQTRTFSRADGVIFLTRYARDTISAVTHRRYPHTVVVPHGVSRRFVCPPRPQRPITEYTSAAPFRLLYVSTVNLYKHQWHVVDAVAQLRGEGLPVTLDLVGPAYAAGSRLLAAKLAGLGPHASAVRYLGAVAYEGLPELYLKADMKVFASSCENMPIIMLEAMSAGLPVACSNRGPMPEMLGDAGVYFDPEQPSEIAAALRALLLRPELRARNASLSFERALQYTWERCAQETFEFLAACVRKH